MILSTDYIINLDCEFLMIFGENYAGKSYCLNSLVKNNPFNESDEMFLDGTTEYQSMTLENGLKIIDTPGLNSILNYQGFSSFRKIWEEIKNKKGLVLLCIDCKQTRFSNMIRKFKLMIDFLNSKSSKEFKVNLCFNRYKNDNITNSMLKKFKKTIPLKLSGFYCYCEEFSREIRYENDPSILITASGFKYFPNSTYNKDLKIPIGDTTIVKKSFNAKFGKDILKLIWQIQQEFEIPAGAITGNKKTCKFNTSI